MPADVIVLGAGGHAGVVIDGLRRAGFSVFGVCAPGLKQGEVGPLGVPAIGGDEVLASLDHTKYLLANGVGSTGKTNSRHGIFEQRTGDGWHFAILIHPSATIGEECKFAEGAQIMAGAVLQCKVSVGRNSIVNTSASIDHDCSIGDHVHIAPGVVMSGSVVVGARSHLGTGAVVIQNISIGDDVIIGAGAVITRAVPAGEHVKAGTRY